VETITIIGPEDARPAGCVALPIASAATVFLHVKGRVDIDAEIGKAKTKLERAEQGIQKQTKLLADPEYGQKVSETVQETDRKKLADLQLQAQSFAETVKQFEHLKLE